VHTYDVPGRFYWMPVQPLGIAVLPGRQLRKVTR
jgi:hypothetical protein